MVIYLFCISFHYCWVYNEFVLAEDLLDEKKFHQYKEINLSKCGFQSNQPFDISLRKSNTCGASKILLPENKRGCSISRFSSNIFVCNLF